MEGTLDGSGHFDICSGAQDHGAGGAKRGGTGGAGRGCFALSGRD